MAVTRIRTGECVVYPDGAMPPGSAVWTEGIGDCVALAIRGATENGHSGTCFAHLHSQQYLMPKMGGRMDDQLPAVPVIKDFIRTHKHGLRCIGATNFDTGLNVRGNLEMRYGLGLKELKHLQAGGNFGVVTLDLDRFQMYAPTPQDASEDKDIEKLPTVESLRPPAPTLFERFCKQFWRIGEVSL